MNAKIGLFLYNIENVNIDEKVIVLPEHNNKKKIMPNKITVSAPFLGSVVELLVSPGDSVKTGEVLLVMEVMKVQNLIVL